jgi:hypothetical protein
MALETYFHRNCLEEEAGESGDLPRLLRVSAQAPARKNDLRRANLQPPTVLHELLAEAIPGLAFRLAQCHSYKAAAERRNGNLQPSPSISDSELEELITIVVDDDLRRDLYIVSIVEREDRRAAACSVGRRVLTRREWQKRTKVRRKNPFRSSSPPIGKRLAGNIC